MANKLKIGFLLAQMNAAVAAFICLGLLAAASVSAATFEGVGHFAGSATPVAEEQFAEEVQLGGAGAMAVNISGAGAVPAGTVYAATQGSGGVRVAMFTPKLDGGLKFSEAWAVTSVEGAYERCGPEGELPDGELVHPNCPTRVKNLPGVVDVDVDQANGNVYVFLEVGNLAAGTKTIVEYSADGGKVVARFGEKAPEGETTAESPAKVHESPYSGGIAVNGSGEVYVYDQAQVLTFYHRLMVFKPQNPGDFEHYVYTGEVAAGVKGNLPTAPVTDAAGNVYVGGGQEGEHIEEYAPQAPAAFPAAPSSPICQFGFEKGGITAMTVNSQNGEVFFFSYKNPKRVHRLSPCSGGKFTELTPALEVKPERDDLWGLVYDPVRKFEPSREAGVLYGGAPGTVPSSGVGKGEPGQSSLGYIFAPVQEDPPLVESESVSKVTATSAQLGAQIAPKGHLTDYVFQYVSEAAFVEGGESFAGAAEAPLGGATLEGAVAPQTAGVTLVGLLPDTEYRYRVVASNRCSAKEPSKVCKDEGAAQGFRTFAIEAHGLPDHRAYELVSPADKHGGQVFPADPSIRSCGIPECKPGGTYEHFPMQSTADGDAIVYEGSAFGPGEGAAIENEYRARRLGSGWQSTNLTPALLQSKGGQGYRAFDPGLSDGVLEQLRPALSPEAPPEYANLYTQTTASPLALGTLLSAPPPNRPPVGAGSFELRYAGASADLSRVFFSANDALTAATPFAPAALDGGASKSNLYEWESATGQLRLVNVAPGNAATEPGASVGVGSAHTISADGQRAFWSSQSGQLFVREGAEITREIPDSGKFLSAAVDGSRVLLGNGHLYDLETETNIDLTSGKGGFLGLVGQSEELTHLYFVDTVVLSGEEENSEGAKAQGGKDNLYAWQEGAVSFVATLAGGDNGGGSANLSSDWNRVPAARTAEASPTGRFVAFLSQARLTGYDNTGPCEEVSGTGKFIEVPCPEAFLYDSATGELHCASCNPSGARPLGWSVLRLIRGSFVFPQPRYLTDSGRLFFDSEDSLNPSDTNEGIEDVYEFEPPGVGDCARPGGCVALISAGREGVDSNFVAADEAGKNIFFTTRDRLVAADQDELIDLYDAREFGGFPQESESSPTQLGLQAPPFEATPASPTLTDPGNVKPPKGCKRGEVKKKGKCVEKHQQRKPKHKKSKRGGSQ